MASKIVAALATFTTAALLTEIGRRSTEQENASKRFQRVLSAINGPTPTAKGRPASPTVAPVLGPDGQPTVRRGPGRPPGSKNKATANTGNPAPNVALGDTPTTA